MITKSSMLLSLVINESIYIYISKKRSHVRVHELLPCDWKLVSPVWSPTNISYLVMHLSTTWPYLLVPRKKNGIYSVKSGYKMLCEEVRREEASGSIRSGGSGLWKGIWKLKVSGKLKHFLWKALIGQKHIDPLW